MLTMWAMMKDSVDEGRWHHLVTEDLAPLLETFVGSQDACASSREVMSSASVPS
jgi:hypothetical protein